MDFPQTWLLLSDSSRKWLIDHNGEPLTGDVVAEILRVTGGELDARWWTGPARHGQTELSDETVDWIETVANDEL